MFNQACGLLLNWNNLFCWISESTVSPCVCVGKYLFSQEIHLPSARLKLLFHNQCMHCSHQGFCRHSWFWDVITSDHSKWWKPCPNCEIWKDKYVWRKALKDCGEAITQNGWYRSREMRKREVGTQIRTDGSEKTFPGMWGRCIVPFVEVVSIAGHMRHLSLEALTLIGRGSISTDVYDSQSML